MTPPPPAPDSAADPPVNDYTYNDMGMPGHDHNNMRRRLHGAGDSSLYDGKPQLIKIVLSSTSILVFYNDTYLAFNSSDSVVSNEVLYAQP